MFQFSLRSVGGSVWPPICDVSVSQIWNAYLQLDAYQWLSAAEILDGQLAQLRRLLEHCEKHVPYYRQLFQQHGIESTTLRTLEDFRRVPILTRRTYQEQQKSFVAIQLPAGCIPTTEPQTSGSSGTPTRVFQTNLVNLWWYACFLRDLQWSGIDPKGSIASIRSTGKRGTELTPFLAGVAAPSWMPALQGLLDMGKAHLLDISQDPSKQMEWLRRVAPQYLISYPANLAALADFARRDGRLKSLRVIQSVSDTLTAETRASIEEAFGVPVKNTYSCVEAGYLASPCPDTDGLHVHAENVLFEVLDDDGLPCRPGETGRVVITTLQNLRGPLVRYDIGDRVTLAGGPCACGRGLPRLESIQGKNSPLFQLPDGRRANSARLSFLIRKVGGHWQHQVVQRKNGEVLVRIARSTDWTEGHEVRLREVVGSFFDSSLAIHVEYCEQMPPPPHGKFQNMVVERDE